MNHTMYHVSFWILQSGSVLDTAFDDTVRGRSRLVSASTWPTCQQTNGVFSYACICLDNSTVYSDWRQLHSEYIQAKARLTKISLKVSFWTVLGWASSVAAIQKFLLFSQRQYLDLLTYLLLRLKTNVDKSLGCRNFGYTMILLQWWHFQLSCILFSNMDL